jgi:hypothetical protein
VVIAPCPVPKKRFTPLPGQWYWLSNPEDSQNPKWIKYDDSQTQLIEESFQKFLKNQVQICEVDGYRIDFIKGIQIRISKPSKSRPVKREGNFSLFQMFKLLINHILMI